MLGFDPEMRPGLWRYHLAKQSILDLRTELEVWNADLRLLDRRGPSAASLQSNIANMEELINLREAKS